MDEFAKSAFVTSISDSPGENRLDATTQSATQFALSPRNHIWRKQAFTAKRTDSLIERAHGIKATPANRQTRNLDQWLAPDAAVGGEQHGEKTLGDFYRGPVNPTSIRLAFFRPGGRCLGTTRSKSNSRARHCIVGPASPNSVLTTAEDGLRVARARAGCLRDRLLAPVYWRSPALGNVPCGRGVRNHRFFNFLRKPVLHRHKQQPIIPAKTIRATHRLQQKNRQHILL